MIATLGNLVAKLRTAVLGPAGRAGEIGLDAESMTALPPSCLPPHVQVSRALNADITFSPGTASLGSRNPPLILVAGRDGAAPATQFRNLPPSKP